MGIFRFVKNICIKKEGNGSGNVKNVFLNMLYSRIQNKNVSNILIHSKIFI